MATPIVDIHCHVFTGKDIPLRGFLRNNGVPDVLARLVDRVVQGGAPDEAFAAAGLAATTEPPEAVLDDIIRRARLEDPELDALIQAELLKVSEVAGLNPVDWFNGARRYVKWALLLREDWPAITDKMIDTYDKDKVDLYTPAMVDFENWLSDKPKTKFANQVAGMKQLALDQRGRLHPLVAFCPKRQLDGGTSLDLGKKAILEDGFVGVKVYPPMGYQPIGNGDFQGGQAAWDGALDELFKFCLDEDVPVMAHCTTHGAQGGPGLGVHSHVKHWKRLLEQPGFANLRLNLAHFGSDAVDQVDEAGNVDDWTEQAAELMSRFPNVYADIGAQSVAHGAPHLDKYVEKIRRIKLKFPVIEDRVMMGTDWHTIIREPKHKDYISRYKDIFRKVFGEGALPKLMGGNALRFLGLDKPGGGNRARLEAFYATNGIAKPKWWVS